MEFLERKPKGIENVKESPHRHDAFKQRCDSMGARVEGFYLTMGRYDLIVILDAQNPEVVAKIILAKHLKEVSVLKRLLLFQRKNM